MGPYDGSTRIIRRESQKAVHVLSPLAVWKFVYSPLGIYNQLWSHSDVIVMLLSPNKMSPDEISPEKCHQTVSMDKMSLRKVSLHESH